VLFGGGSFWQIFPLRGLTSDNFAELSTMGKILDYLWHIALPITASVVGSFAVVTMLTKNAFLDEIRRQYVLTARAKGLSERSVLWKHVFRNAMLPLVVGFPAAFIGAFFLELVQTFAVGLAAEAWNAIIGLSLLIVIFFLPEGLYGLIQRLERLRASPK